MVSLTAAGIAKLGTATVETVEIVLETTVNGNVSSDDENAIQNGATIELYNGVTVGTDLTQPANIHTGEIVINKTYSGGTVDKSAQFQLAKSETDAAAGDYLRVVLDSSGTYIEDIVAPGEAGV